MEKAASGLGLFNKNRLLYNEFKGINGLTILTKSLASFHPGEVVEWDNNVLDNENYSFIDDLKIEELKRNELKNALINLPFVDCVFTSLEMTKSTGFGANLNIPNIGFDIKAKFGTEKLVKFSFENIKGRIIGDTIKGQIKNIIRNAKEEDGKYYRKYIKNKYIFDELYYAESFELTVEKTSDTDIGAALEGLKIEPEITVLSEKSYKVVFPGSNTCPFAAKIESLKDYL